MLKFLMRSHAVKIRLDEPMTSVIELHSLISMCFVADAFIERVQRGGEEEAELFDVGILQSIEAACKRLDPSREATDLLQSLGVLDVFPYLRQSISGMPLEPVANNPAQSYFSYIMQLNQVVMMGVSRGHPCLT